MRGFNLNLMSVIDSMAVAIRAASNEQFSTRVLVPVLTEYSSTR